MTRVLPFSFLVLAIGCAACSHKQEPVTQIAEQPAPAAKKPQPSPTAEATPQTTPSVEANAEDDADGVPAEMEVKDSAESRFGKLRVAAKEGDYHYKLYFNGKEISEYEGPIRLYEVFNGQDRDYVVGANDSGGIACPLAPFILEISDREKSELFDDFGDCRGDVKASFVDDKVILEIPPYFPHPDLIPKKELKDRMKKMEVFTWSKGRLIKQETQPVRR
jgi:hypothetical protein